MAKTRIALMWTLQTQFAGYVLAREHELPDLELLPRVPGRSPIQQLLDRRAEFGIVSPAHLLSAGPAASELVLVGLFMARSPVRLAGLLDRVGDRLEGRERRLRIGIWAGEDIELRAILHSSAVDAAKLDWVDVSDEAGALLSGEVDYVQCTTYNELPAIIRASGGEDRVIVHSPVSWGVDVPKDGLVVRRDLLQTDRGRVVEVLRAAIAGWRRALDAPLAAAEEVCAVVPELDPAQQAEQMQLISEMFEPGHALGEPRLSDLDRARHAASVAGMTALPELLLDHGPWQDAHG